MVDIDVLDHYRSFCASEIWLDKIKLKQLHGLEITCHDLTDDLLTERNRILSPSSGIHNRKELRKCLNAIASKYISKIRTAAFLDHLYAL